MWRESGAHESREIAAPSMGLPVLQLRSYGLVPDGSVER